MSIFKAKQRGCLTQLLRLCQRIYTIIHPCVVGKRAVSLVQHEGSLPRHKVPIGRFSPDRVVAVGSLPVPIMDSTSWSVNSAEHD
jgi:hypothetical protein